MNKVIEERTKRTEWYRDARFGMFIHRGLMQSLPEENGVQHGADST